MKFKKSMKRMVSMLAVLSLSATMFVGCGSDTKGNDDNSKTENNETKKEEKVTLKHLGAFSEFDPNTDPVAEALKEKTGYDVEYFMLPAENAIEKLSLEISGGTSYDSIKMNSPEYNLLTAQGALMPLDDLIDQYGPNIKKAIGEDSWNAAKVDGKIYGIPEKNSADNINLSIGVREDVLAELGLEVPKTIDEFYNALKTIKEETDMIPLALSSDYIFIPTIQSAFGIETNWKEIDGNLVSKVEQPGFKDYVDFMVKLYEEGLIDPDMPVNNKGNSMEKFTNGTAAMKVMAWWDAPKAIPALEENVPGAKVAYIQPLIGKDGQQGIMKDRGISWYTAIPKTAKNAEEAIKWIDAKFAEDTFKYFTIGEEGVHHTVQDGKYFPVLPTFFDERNRSSWYLSGIDETNYPIYWAARVRKDENMSNAYDEFMKAQSVASFEPLGFAPALEDLAKYEKSLATLVNDSVLNFIAGEGNTEGFDEFVQKWNTSGGQASTQAANGWYNTSK